MALYKFGEAISIVPEDIQDTNDILSNADLEMNERMKKFALELKTIAPQASDFLYFTAVMMHAAEASLYDDSGSLRKDGSGNAVVAHWEKLPNNSIKWVCSDPSIKPYKNSNCFVAGTHVLMADGSVKNIEDIKVGDEVITHQNRKKKVTHTFKNKVDEELVKLKISNNRELFCTKDHPFFNVQITSKDSTASRAIKNGNFDYRFIEADSLNKGDIVCSPVINDIKKSNISKDRARLAGLFAAEGSYRRQNGKLNGIQFSFGQHEFDNLAKETKDLLEKEFSCTASLCKGTPSQPTKCSIYVRSKKAANFFKKHVGQYSGTKKLSNEIVFGNSDVKQGFLTGWFEGDGHVDKSSGKLVGTTISKSLASQTRVMLNSLGINNSLYSEKPSQSIINNRVIQGVSDVFRVKVPYNEAKVFIQQSNKLNAISKKVKDIKLFRFNDLYGIHKVLSKEYEHFNGYVYNFEVEDDHSYVANGIITHNCDIFPESELKLAYPKWVGRPLCLDHKSSSVDMIRGVIVDTHWDDARKRIIALCALDKKNYPDLARKVTSGYATNVSMGTAVGRAVCTEDGCHRVARVESDFCEHMKKRSCYGEINLDLSPIELSLVVTGADPKAKVKHIIAKDLSEARRAASALQDYLDGKIAIASVEDSEVELIKEELANLNERVAKLQESLDKAEAVDSDENSAQGPTKSDPEMKESDIDVHKASYSAPEEWSSFAGELAAINKKLDKLSSLHNSEGSTMTEKKAYWQGTEEPTPGKPQYSVDPGDSARMQDKHMVGQSPFPDVGPVDGMHPGHESHEGSEEERKRKLQRLAEQQKRESMRKAALAEAQKNLESFAYPQGTEEPTPAGKPQYTPDPLQEKARGEDKHMVGKKPFPEGGNDGLYGDDLKVKEMLSRAKLKATFKKASASGKLNKGASRWEVSAGDHLILTASVDEITRGNSEAIYDMVATADFGRSMIKHIQSEGFEAARGKFKGAQAAPAMGAGMPGAPMNEGEPTGMPDMGGLGDLGDSPSSDELKEALSEISQIIDDTLNDMTDGDKAIEEDASTLEAVKAAPSDESGFSKASVSSMRRTVNAMLGESFKETIATLQAHKDELQTANYVVLGKYASFDSKNKIYFTSLVDKAISDAKKTVADCKELTGAFVRYAHGTNEHLKKVAQNRPDFSQEHVSDMGAGEQRVPLNYDGTLFDDVTKGNLGHQESGHMDTSTDEMRDRTQADDASFAKDKKEDDKKEDDKKEDDKDDDKKDEAKDKKDDESKADDNFADVTVSAEDLGKLPPDTKINLEASAPDLKTKEGRAMYRAKLAKQGLEFSDMLGKAHPKGGHTPGQMDIKPSGDLAKVERIDEVSKAMHDLANMPPKVRKQAQEIAQLVHEGKLAAEDVDGLAAYAVDKDAINYYKKYWAEAKDPQTSEFAAKLVEEQKKAKAGSDLEKQTVKIKRAHELAYEMRDRGMIDTSQVNQQVKEILSWNDEGFSSVKNIVAKQEPLSKTASVPQVGLLHSGDVYLPSAVSAGERTGTSELVAALESHFAKNHKRH